VHTTFPDWHQFGCGLPFLHRQLSEHAGTLPVVQQSMERTTNARLRAGSEQHRYQARVLENVPLGQAWSLPPRQEQRQPYMPQRNQSLQLWARAVPASRRKAPVVSRVLSARRSQERRVDAVLGGA